MKTYIDGLKAAREIVERATKKYYSSSPERGFESVLLLNAVKAIGDIETGIQNAITEAEKDE